MSSVGQPVRRVEGEAKVTGQARYAADHRFSRLAYGSVVTSPIARGRIASIDSSLAERAPGVVVVVTHLNAPEVPGYSNNPMSAIPIYAGKEFKPLLDDR